MRRYTAIAVLVALALCALASAQPQTARPPRPYVVGIVTTVGDNGMTLTIKSPSQPNPVTVTSDANTKLYQGVDVPVDQLKVGDHIVVSGIPVKLQAVTLQVGDDFSQLEGAALGRKVTPARPRASGMVVGAVASVQPLTVNINGLSIEIDTTAKTEVVTFQTMADATAIKSTSKLIAVGQRAGDNLTATLIVLDSTAKGLQSVTNLGPYVSRAKPAAPKPKPKPQTTPAPAAGDQTPAAGDQTPAAGDQAPAAGDQAPAGGDQTPGAGGG